MIGTTWCDSGPRAQDLVYVRVPAVCVRERVRHQMKRKEAGSREDQEGSGAAIAQIEQHLLRHRRGRDHALHGRRAAHVGALQRHGHRAYSTNRTTGAATG